MSKSVSIAKPNDHAPNEDAVFCSPQCIAVSDGAGGCGLYADEWSRYLIEHLPKDAPLCSFTELDEWVDGIWEEFYNEHEEQAKKGDGILLNKFYNEGSCATIAAAWGTEQGQCRWMTYGDSVVFHYNLQTGLLEHSFTRLTDFSNPPRLVSCKDPLEEEGFRSGVFHLDDTSVVFAASDALSHYCLMMYELSKSAEFESELMEVRMKQTTNLQLLQMAEKERFDFNEDVLMPLLRSADSEDSFKDLLESLYAKKLIDIDDYTLAILYA